MGNQAKNLWDMVLERNAEDEDKGVFLETFELVLKVIGNILFLVLLTVVVGWLISIGVNWLPVDIQNWLMSGSSIGLIVKIALYAGSIYLSLMEAALRIRKFVHFYKLTELFAYFELGRMVFMQPDEPFIITMLEALKHTFLG
jgi:hypothetical protein